MSKQRNVTTNVQSNKYCEKYIEQGNNVPNDVSINEIVLCRMQGNSVFFQALNR